MRIQRCSKNRCRKIRAASAQRRQLPFGGCANEASHQRDDSFFQQRAQSPLGFSPRSLHLRLGPAMKRVCHNQLGGFDRFACRTCVPNSCRHQWRGKPFSQAGHRVESAWRQFPQQSGPLAKPAAFRKNVIQFPANDLAFLFLRNQTAQSGFVLLAKRLQNAHGSGGVPRARMIGGFDQPVRDAAHRGNHCHATPLLGCIHDDLRRPRDARRVAHRRPAKLHYL